MHVSAPSPSADAHCGVVLLHGGNGLEPVMIRFAKRLALSGYTAVAPDLFHRDPDGSDMMARIKRLSWAELRTDIEAALDLLRGEYGVTGRIAVMGYCFGGAVALMAAAELPFTAAVLFYPHEVFGPFGTGGDVPVERVARLNVPVLGHFGALDTNPSQDHMRRLDEALTAQGVVHQFYTYLGANHGFAGSNPNRSVPIAANTAYDRTIGWFDRYIRPIPTSVGTT
jgi:carboxymethylenebutenolidase